MTSADDRASSLPPQAPRLPARTIVTVDPGGGGGGGGGGGDGGGVGGTGEACGLFVGTLEAVGAAPSVRCKRHPRFLQQRSAAAPASMRRARHIVTYLSSTLFDLIVSLARIVP